MGYPRYQQLSSHKFKILDIFSSFKNLTLNKKENSKTNLNKSLEDKTNLNNFKNILNEYPFRNYKVGIPSIPMKYHLFMDFSGAYGKNKLPSDFFGFKNKENLYFENKCDLLVVFIGGSEGVGWSHKISISENIKIRLQKAYKSQKI